MDSVRPWQWVVFSSLGWIVGVIAVILISGPFETVGLGKTAVGLGMTGGVSAVQWIALRNRFVHAARWMPASLFGMGIPFLIIDLFRDSLPLAGDEQHMIAATAVGALLTATLQYQWVLRERVPLFAWLGVNLVGWLLALALPFVFSVSRINAWQLPGPVKILISFVTVLGGGLIIGWLTGTVLMKSLSNSRNEPG